jgi:NDP-sugar pyrophosphorylase family protein
MNKRAVILAGGKGTRLRPYTIVLPKPLMPIGEYPILEIVIRQLVKCGFDHITIAINHQVELIRSFFGDGSKWSVLIDYSLEDTPLGTMGPLRLIEDLPEQFLVLNGDVLTDLDFSDFFSDHISHNRLFTISSYLREQFIDYGVLETDAKGELRKFCEKPTKRHEVSMGIYMVNRNILRYLPKSGPYGFNDLMLELLKRRKTVNVKRFNGYWLDIGRPDDYQQAIEEFSAYKSRFLRE